MAWWKSIALLSALILLSVLLFGATVHAIVPHEHSGAELVWASIHDSLRHEDKKSLPLSFLFVLIGSVAMVVFSRLAPIDGMVRIIDDVFDALRRGIFAYRRFG